MRVLMTADAVGGVWTYALDLARGLAGHGVATTLLTLGPPPTADQGADAESIPALDLVVTALALDWTAETAVEIGRTGETVARLAGDSRCNLVHLNSPALAAEARFAVPVIAVAHSCMLTWWRAVRDGPPPDEFRWRSDLVRRGYGRADAVIAPSASFAKATVEAYRVDPPVVVHNGRATRLSCPSYWPSRPHPEVPAEQASKENTRGHPGACFETELRSAPQHEDGGLSRTTPASNHAFTAGRLWDDGKNVAALDRAAARISVPFLAAGALDGPNGTRASFPNLRCLGRLDDARIAAELAQGPVFVSTALYEPFGLAVLEAAQAGCALVLSDIPTFRELWDGAAIFVPPNAEGVIARAIEDVIGDPVARAALAAAACERSTRYSVEAMTAGVLAVYRSVLGRKLGQRSPASRAQTRFASAAS